LLNKFTSGLRPSRKITRFDRPKLKDYLEIAGFDEYAGSFKARLALTFKNGGYTIG